MSVKSAQKKQLTGLFYAVCGGVLFAAGVNLFITPLDLYNGGFMGIAQLIRTLLTSALHLSFGQTDIAGIVYFLVNLPLLYLAWSKMGRGFFSVPLSPSLSRQRRLLLFQFRNALSSMTV